jgi:mono/diheme cytochrome c family protein
MKKNLISTTVILLIATHLFAQHKPKARVAAGSRISFTTSVANGEKVYVQYCLSCHQVDGGGVSRMNPPLINTSYVKGDKVRLIKVVLNGFTENVDIDGESYSNNMASHDFLKDQEIADVLTYVRNAFGNKGTAIKALEVKAVRAANKK